jgi:hypothetical protein
MATSEGQRGYLNTLLRQLIASFDLEELRTLCFELGVDYDTLRGEGKAGKARELVLSALRTRRLPNLVEAARGLRPNISWPVVPPEFEGSAGSIDDYLEEIDIESDAEPGTVFNFSGPIHSGATFYGGSHTFEQPINIDMRGTDAESEEQALHRDRAERFADYPDAARAITSRLDRAARAVEALSIDEARKKRLLDLLNDLKEQLVQAPARRVADADDVSRRIEALLREVAEKQPDQDMIAITAESLTRATQDVADILPAVPSICARIVDQAKSPDD